MVDHCNVCHAVGRSESKLDGFFLVTDHPAYAVSNNPKRQDAGCPKQDKPAEALGRGRFHRLFSLSFVKKMPCLRGALMVSTAVSDLAPEHPIGVARIGKYQWNDHQRTWQNKRQALIGAGRIPERDRRRHNIGEETDQQTDVTEQKQPVCC